MFGGLQDLELTDNFLLGVPEIDGDHQVMLDLIKAVMGAVRVRNDGRCERYLNRLFAYTQSHFEREERLLRNWNFPDIDKHKSYHTALLARAESLREVCRNVESEQEYQTCCEQMMSFLVDDVIRGDVQLKSFVERAGLALPA
jgi:hemerythrin-like metal-binding protein